MTHDASHTQPETVRISVLLDQHALTLRDGAMVCKAGDWPPVDGAMPDSADILSDERLAYAADRVIGHREHLAQILDDAQERTWEQGYDCSMQDAHHVLNRLGYLERRGENTPNPYRPCVRNALCEPESHTYLWPCSLAIDTLDHDEPEGLTEPNASSPRGFGLLRQPATEEDLTPITGGLADDIAVVEIVDDVYVCPTTGETESLNHSGFDVCCDHPYCPGNPQSQTLRSVRAQAVRDAADRFVTEHPWEGSRYRAEHVHRDLNDYADTLTTPPDSNQDR